MPQYYYLNFDDLNVKTYQSNPDPLFLFINKSDALNYYHQYLKLKAHQRIRYQYNHQTIPKDWYQTAITEYVRNSDLSANLNLQTIHYQALSDPELKDQLYNYHFVLNANDHSVDQYLSYMYTKLENETEIALS